MTPGRREGAALGAWAGAGGALFLALAAFEVLALRPGLGAPEELINLAYIAHASETWRFWLRPGGGALSRSCMVLALELPGGWRSIYLFNVLALGGAAWGLWNLGRKLGGVEAAAFTLVFAYGAAFSFLQARTTFSYVLAPALLLALMWALRRPEGAVSSAVLGLIAALAWMDYEAWIFTAPALALAWGTAPKHGRARPGPLCLGLLAGGLCLALLEAPYGGEWLAQRGLASGAAAHVSVVGNLARNLEGFFFGATGSPAMGLERVAAFPWPAWPGLLVGLAVAPAWLWAWALGGLLGLAAGGPFLEPNRAIIAWPALLLISGLGSAWIWRRWCPRLSPAWLGLGLLLAPLCGYLQFDRAISGWDARIHGPSRQVFQMAAFLENRSRHNPVTLGPALEFQDTPLLERCFSPAAAPPGIGAEAWFLVPRALADPSDARWGRWVAFTSDGDAYPLYLLHPSPRAEAFLDRAALDLAGEPGVLTLPGRAQGLALEGEAARSGNAWSWTAWSGLRLRRALQVGRVSAGDVLPLLRGPCLSTEPLEAIQAALGYSQPRAAALARERETALERPGRRWQEAFGKS